MRIALYLILLSTLFLPSSARPGYDATRSYQDMVSHGNESWKISNQTPNVDNPGPYENSSWKSRDQTPYDPDYNLAEDKSYWVPRDKRISHKHASRVPSGKKYPDNKSIHKFEQEPRIYNHESGHKQSSYLSGQEYKEDAQLSSYDNPEVDETEFDYISKPEQDEDYDEVDNSADHQHSQHSSIPSENEDQEYMYQTTKRDDSTPVHHISPRSEYAKHEYSYKTNLYHELTNNENQDGFEASDKENVADSTFSMNQQNLIHDIHPTKTTCTFWSCGGALTLIMIGSLTALFLVVLGATRFFRGRRRSESVKSRVVKIFTCFDEDSYSTCSDEEESVFPEISPRVQYADQEVMTPITDDEMLKFRMV